jgi:GntR family transcriptional regulator, sialic acid-inducible nan operon repressor
MAMTTIAPIQRRKLFQEVLDRLIERIRSGEFHPGDQLPSERELMTSYGVGRPAVREALQALERAGIVTISHGERARVVMPTAGSMIEQIASAAQHLLSVEPGMLQHLKDARLFLETGLARRAAAGVTPESLDLLRQRLDAHVEARNRLDAFLPRDMEFHREIAAMTDNPIFPAIVEAMFGWLGAFYVDLVSAPGAEDLTIAEHQRIFRAIAEGDPEEAAAAMHDHIARANDLYRQFERER